MSLKKILFILILNLSSFLINGQELISVTKTETMATDADTFLGFDNQNNYYNIKNNVLIKTNQNKIYRYNNLGLGKITKVDFQNPLQIVVFYKNFNTVVLLDNQLNEIKKIDFNLKPTPVTLEAVALSSQNQIWIYDSITSKIGLYNVNSDTFKWVSTTLVNPISYYQSDYIHFYWIDTDKTLYKISIYGAIEKINTIPEFDSIQLTKNNNCIYQFNNQLFYFNTSSNSNSKLPIDKKIISNFFFRDGFLSIFTQNEITNYKIILP